MRRVGESTALVGHAPVMCLVLLYFTRVRAMMAMIEIARSVFRMYCTTRYQRSFGPAGIFAVSEEEGEAFSMSESSSVAEVGARCGSRRSSLDVPSGFLMVIFQPLSSVIASIGLVGVTAAVVTVVLGFSLVDMFERMGMEASKKCVFNATINFPTKVG